MESLGQNVSKNKVYLKKKKRDLRDESELGQAIERKRRDNVVFLSCESLGQHFIKAVPSLQLPRFVNQQIIFLLKLVEKYFFHMQPEEI